LQIKIDMFCLQPKEGPVPSFIEIALTLIVQTDLAKSTQHVTLITIILIVCLMQFVTSLQNLVQIGQLYHIVSTGTISSK